MKSLYTTLYFSSIVIPGALQASGMCLLRGRALSLCQGESRTGSWQPVCPGVSQRDPLHQSSFGVLPWPSYSCKRCTFCSSAHCWLDTARDHKWTRDWDNFLTKRGSCWRKNVALPRQSSLPACQRATEAVSSHRDLRGWLEGGNFCYNYVAAFPSAGALRDWRFSTSCTLFTRANPYCWHLTGTRELRDHCWNRNGRLSI